MYHIPEDLRAKKSASLLGRAMLECLDDQPFSKVSVSDLNRKSYVSRSTFYRLFDNTYDVMVYLCDNMYEEIFFRLKEKSFSSVPELMTAFNCEVMSGSRILDALAKNNMTDILYSTHVKHYAFFIPYFKELSRGFSDKEINYALSILSGSLCSYITWWVKNGKKESPEELASIVGKCFLAIAAVTPQ